VIAPTREASTLAAVLDVDRTREDLLAAFRRAGVAGTGRPSVARVHFRRKAPIVIQYTLLDERGLPSAQLHGELLAGPEAALRHAETESVRLRKSRRAQARREEKEPVVAVPGLALCVRAAGRDANLPGLRLLHDRDALHDFVASLAGASAADVASVRLRAHRLGKRAVLQIDAGPARRFFVRLAPQTHEAGLARHRRHAVLAAALCAERGSARVRLPAALGFDASLGAAVYESLPGTPADDPDVRDDDIARAAIAVVEALTDLPRADAPDQEPASEMALLHDWHARLAAHLPALAPAYGRALDTLESQMRRMTPVDPGPCHRDLHEGQIMIAPDTVGVLDFDTFCVGDPDLDAGNLLAHLRWRASLGRGGWAAAGRVLRALAASRGQGRLTRIEGWARVSTLRILAIHAFATATHRRVARDLIGAAAR
jgi:aminoglycoside phosphotransferase (APT) family kinase protein